MISEWSEGISSLSTYVFWHVCVVKIVASLSRDVTTLGGIGAYVSKNHNRTRLMIYRMMRAGRNELSYGFNLYACLILLIYVLFCVLWLLLIIS